jgi:hypothetical protein
MNPGEAERMVKTLQAMRELELVVAEFYGLCGASWKEDAEMWLNIEQTERQHAQYIERIIRLLEEKPEHFEIGCTLDIGTVRKEISDLKGHIGKMKEGALGRREALQTLEAAEESILECQYTEMLVTRDIDYNYWISEIVSQTETHKRFIARKIEELK